MLSDFTSALQQSKEQNNLSDTVEMFLIMHNSLFDQPRSGRDIQVAFFCLLLSLFWSVFAFILMLLQQSDKPLASSCHNPNLCTTSFVLAFDIIVGCTN